MRFDRFSTGFILGLIAPVFGLLGYGTIYVTALHPEYDLAWFVTDLFLGTPALRAPVLSLSLIADAILFFVLDTRDLYKAMRGVIGAMFLYGAVILVCLT
jgi:hypothetical protein